MLHGVPEFTRRSVKRYVRFVSMAVDTRNHTSRRVQRERVHREHFYKRNSSAPLPFYPDEKNNRGRVFGGVRQKR